MFKRKRWIILLLAVPLLAWIAFINFPGRQHPYSPSIDEASDDVSANQTEQADEPGTIDQVLKEPASTLPFNISLVYSPSYLINVGGLERMHPFDIKKYQRICDALVKDGVCEHKDFLSPEPLTNDDLLLVHTPKYLQSLASRTKVAGYLEAPILMLAPVSLDTAILQPFRHASGGTLLASRAAIRSGIGINLGGGYHHAKPHTGEGFCLFADVPIAIRRLQAEKLIQRAVVVDVDVHQGNGTILCLPDDDTTFTFSMHQRGIYPLPKEKGDLDIELPSGMNDDEYLRELSAQLPAVLDQSQADICFVVGGCDTLDGDPLASLRMTHQGIVRRDQMIIDECIKRNIAVVFTLSGGYSKDAWKAQYESVKNLINRQTLAAP
ncbi:histone deacetylase [Planctomycetes bacterium K23_9]|uniref:Acetoin utilization protein AcuC n=1 Tax=Stieleria marina TaxID=1930275 RepID=A0A517P376_9BACT|nr:Acetoin utilization protein AcuC [Planctomycetes bacterium K23_9]